MKRVLATAGHVDHGKSTLVRALTGRDPDRLDQEKARGLTIELGFAWTRLPGGADVAFVDVPGHQRFVGTTLSGLGPAPAVLFVVAADQGWQAQSSEHLAALQALGVTDGLLVLTRCDLADDTQRATTRADAERHLTAAGVRAATSEVSAVTGKGLDDVRTALADLVARLPGPDAAAPVRLWADRSFTISGAGTVVTGTLGAGTLRAGDTLTLLTGDREREASVRGLHSEDEPHTQVGPVSRVAVNLRRLDTDEVHRGAVLLTPGAYAVARVIDVTLQPVDPGLGDCPRGPGGTQPGGGIGQHGADQGHRSEHALPQEAILHVGTSATPVHVRPLGTRHVRLTLDAPLPWRVGDRAILRDPGSRRIWSVAVADVDPLPLRRRGAARARAGELDSGAANTRPGSPDPGPAEPRLRSRGAEHSDTLTLLGLAPPAEAVQVGSWWVDPPAAQAWSDRVAQAVRSHHRDHPLSPGMPTAEVVHLLGLPEHLRPAAEGGSLPRGVTPLTSVLLPHLVDQAGLRVTEGRVHDPRATGLGVAEAAVAALEDRLRTDPFAAPERDDLATLGLGAAELAAAARLGRVLRLPEDIVLLPDGPARAMRELAALPQPFTLSAARQALGTTRRVAVPLLEHLDSRGWTRRVDGQLRRVVR